jgi:hypothetical protein
MMGTFGFNPEGGYDKDEVDAEIARLTKQRDIAQAQVAGLLDERDALKNSFWAEVGRRTERLTKQRDELARTVEMTYKMLLSEPNTKGALFKAENLLREALAKVKQDDKN